MRKLVTFLVPAAMTGGLAGAAHAGGLEISVEIPQINAAEYHRPYVAIWIEGADNKVAANLAVWYQTKAGGEDGRKWLKDIRQWWRRAGRDLTLPADGLSSPTKPPGVARLRVDSAAPSLASLPAGDYKLMIEAVREVGGRELVEIPFKWAPGAEGAYSGKGATELGAVTLKLVK